MRVQSIRLLAVAIAFATVTVGVWQAAASAQQTDSGAQAAEGFALQVSPSPLVASIKPGESSVLELRVRNTGGSAQDLRMGLQAFRIDENSGEVDLESKADSLPAEIRQMVRFERPEFRLAAGEITTQRLTISVPADAGFTYSFATTVSQQRAMEGGESQANIRGTVAVFTLISVDKPGASRSLQLERFATDKRSFEFLPANFTVRLKNDGNTLVQPKGTLYIQRGSDDTKPIAAIPINESSGYILPDSARQLSIGWNDGWPKYVTKDTNGTSSTSLMWNQDIGKLRFGKYTAKLVAVYDDGRRDVPLEAEVSFWVIPWRIIAVLAVVLLLIVVGVLTVLRKSGKVLRRATKKSGRSKVDGEDT